MKGRDDTRNGISETFGYDGLERLTSWTWSGGAAARGVQYVYDDIGNLQQRNVTAGPGTSVTYGYGGPNFGPHQVASDGGTTEFAYDERGNQLAAPARSFAYDTFDHLASVTATAGTYAMTYDADYARFSRTDPSGHVRTSYGGLFDEFADAAGTHYVMEIMAAGRPVAEVEKVVKNSVLKGTTVNAVLVDALGSVDALVGANGKPQAIKYDPFGARVQASDPTVHITTAPQDLRAGFTGHDHDDDVDLIDMVGRVYDPAQQRFLGVDPPAPNPIDGQAFNPYAYVRNNPLNATDPTGYYEVTLDGMMIDHNGENLYGTAAYMNSVPGDSALTPYGLLPGESQGPKGTDGPGATPNGGGGGTSDGSTDGAASGYTGRRVGPGSLGSFQLALDPNVALAWPKLPTDAPNGGPSLGGFASQLDPLRRALGPNPAGNAVFLLAAASLATTSRFSGASAATPAQIAKLTESVYLNWFFGTCADTSRLSAFLGIVNGYQTTVETFWLNTWRPDLPEEAGRSHWHWEGHAVAGLSSGSDPPTFLSWGGTWPSIAAIASRISWSYYTMKPSQSGKNYVGWFENDILTPSF